MIESCACLRGCFNYEEAYCAGADYAGVTARGVTARRFAAQAVVARGLTARKHSA